MYNYEEEKKKFFTKHEIMSDPEGWDLESVYDEQIAPLMTQIISKCKEHGIPMAAKFRYSDDGYVDTVIPVDGRDKSAEILIAILGVTCRGNLDSLVMNAARRARKTGHSSLILMKLDIPLAGDANSQ